MPEIPLRCQLHFIGITKKLAQLIIQSSNTLAIEIALTFIEQGITSTHILAQRGSQPGFLLTTPTHLQHHIHRILDHTDHSHSIPINPVTHTLQPTSTLQPISDTPFSLFIKHNRPSFYNTSHLSFPHFTHYHKAFHRLTLALFSFIRATPIMSTPQSSPLRSTSLSFRTLQQGSSYSSCHPLYPLRSYIDLFASLSLRTLHQAAFVQLTRIITRSLLGRF